MKSFSTWLTALMLLLFGLMVFLAFRYPPGARFVPLVVGIPGMLLCLLQLGLDWSNAPGGRLANHRFRSAPKFGNPDELRDDLAELGSHTLSRELVMWCYFLAFVAALLMFGFYVAVPVMLVAFLHREARIGWRRALLAGAGGTAALYLMFGVALRFQLFPGFVTRSAMNVFGL